MLPVGSISFLYFSDRLMEFPLGVFGIALGTVTLPYLSSLWAKDDRTAFRQTLDWSLKLAVLIAVPAAIGLFVLAEPLVTTLFFGGSFDERSVRMTTLSLQAYSAGLIGFSLVKILAPAYFAREDTRTPVRIALVALAVNLLLSIGLAWYLTMRDFAAPHAGLAAATSVAALLNAAMLYVGLKRERTLRHSAGWLLLMTRVLLACAAMIAVLYQLLRPLEWWVAASLTGRVGMLALTVVCGAAAYVATMLMLGMRVSHLRLRAD